MENNVTWPRNERNFPQASPPLIAYTRPQSIRQKLIRAKLPPRKPKRIVNGMFKCKKGCKICPYVKTCKSIKAVHTGKIVHIQKYHDCQTSNMVYLIQCKKCKWATYIGESKETLEKRFSQHLGYVKRHEDTATGNHFNLPGHSTSLCNSWINKDSGSIFFSFQKITRNAARNKRKKMKTIRRKKVGNWKVKLLQLQQWVN